VSGASFLTSKHETANPNICRSAANSNAFLFLENFIYVSPSATRSNSDDISRIVNLDLIQIAQIELNAVLHAGLPGVVTVAPTFDTKSTIGLDTQADSSSKLLSRVWLEVASRLNVFLGSRPIRFLDQFVFGCRMQKNAERKLFSQLMRLQSRLLNGSSHSLADTYYLACTIYD
jgi:hypothetical protein